METEEKIFETMCRMQYWLAKDFLNDLYESEIDFAILKGCPLAYYKTGRPGTRMSSDIDILVARQDINRTISILKRNGYESIYDLNREERVMVISHSHQIPSYGRRIGNVCSQIDINFDLFWGEYQGKRIDVSDFLHDTREMEFYGCKIKALSPINTMIQIILHHYKEMNSLYHLSGHIAIKKRMFEDIYLILKKYPDEITVEKLYELSSKYDIVRYVYYMIYYTRKVYDDIGLDVYINALRTDEGEALLDYYGLTESERKKWEVSFEERLDRNVSAIVYADLTVDDKEKIERSKRIFG